MQAAGEIFAVRGPEKEIRRTLEVNAGSNQEAGRVEGEKGESDSIKDLRNATLKLLGTYGRHEETIKEARQRFNAYLEDRESVPADIAAVILSIVAFNGSNSEYDRVRTALSHEKVPAVRPLIHIENAGRLKTVSPLRREKRGQNQLLGGRESVGHVGKERVREPPSEKSRG